MEETQVSKTSAMQNEHVGNHGAFVRVIKLEILRYREADGKIILGIIS